MQESEKAITDQPEIIVLSKRDQELFLTALENPSEPSPRLIEAMERYKNS